ncbi:hypothetical protein GLOTRDRAFT_32348 [Gloeophyllum trabeum ATCC 11539]|uniref:Uncharacterized protein n=1 Tax=Gloeophyllum trabeum (strain ATCC 11539 / FP-39264 / Madison 617) TaxID=670483 RepID=S7QPK0_GLOTA|nr:uncharacterized protein GLOTRDRAFT_32348 [Gloeophyllum trabeum ATCC 11539]EPQ61267.1 hypothetical protein GLOTRDRAFT_32348 [Gloeophyllum trabeum ATCC 11539]
MRSTIFPSASRLNVSASILLIALVARASAGQCSPGTYSSNGQKPCQDCPAGTYQSQSGATSCTAAQAGWYAKGTGNKQQEQCGQGYYSTGHASECTICPAGSYCNSNTQTQPQYCQPGRYSPYPGAKQDCLECPRGTFNNVYGATACCTCCSGWYTDQTGQTHCFNCPNRGSQQQGWSPAGSTSAGQCIDAPGALSSCSQTSSGTCPAAGGAISSQRKRAAGSVEYCGKPGHKSCPIWNAVQGNAGHASQTTLYRYECVDIANDIESCGGCVDDSRAGTPSTDGGRDCSAIPHVDDVSCSNGTCKIRKCSRGFMLSEDQDNCIPARQKRKVHYNHGSHVGGNVHHRIAVKGENQHGYHH